MSEKLMAKRHNYRGLRTHATGDADFDELFAWLGDGSTAVRDQTTAETQDSRELRTDDEPPSAARLELVRWSRGKVAMTGLVITHNGRTRLVRDVPKTWKRMTWSQLRPRFENGRPLIRG